ncbi:MAG: WecB/TagA/CpsF family glycosyltransferase [Vicinamibacterales bacterium]
MEFNQLPVPTVDVLGIPIGYWTPDTLVDQMVAWALSRSVLKRTILYANVHVLNTATRHPALAEELRRASAVYCDGSGVRLGAWLLGQTLPPRLTATDWIDLFCSRARERGLRLYILAGIDGVASRAAEILCARHPGLRIVGSHHGYLGATTSVDVIADINRQEATILIVGMGSPIQERWIAENRHRIDAKVVWAVGGLFDFIAGVQERAPAILTRHHLEWLGRLTRDPGRLAGRYLIGNPLFCWRVLRQRISQR